MRTQTSHHHPYYITKSKHNNTIFLNQFWFSKPISPFVCALKSVAISDRTRCLQHQLLWNSFIFQPNSRGDVAEKWKIDFLTGRYRHIELLPGYGNFCISQQNYRSYKSFVAQQWQLNINDKLNSWRAYYVFNTVIIAIIGADGQNWKYFNQPLHITIRIWKMLIVALADTLRSRF